jgi:hypothetical protein
MPLIQGGVSNQLNSITARVEVYPWPTEADHSNHMHQFNVTFHFSAAVAQRTHCPYSSLGVLKREDVL